MKKIILFLFLSMTAKMLSSQVLVNLQLPATGLTVKSQLWSLSLVNSSGQDMNVEIEMEMTDVSNNQTVLLGTSKLFGLPRGVKQVSGSDVLPVIYSVNNPAYNIDPGPDGFLPVGIFSICFTAIRFDEKGSERLAQECAEIQIEPLAPPTLINPADSEALDMQIPFFVWLPPVPNNLFSNLQYDLYLVEINGSQTAAEAIQQNLPVLFQQNILTNNFQYPLSAPELDTSKTYGWQVVAKNNSTPIATSEAWSFRVKKLGLDTSQIFAHPMVYYTKLSRKNDEAFALCNGILHYAYLNESNTDTVQVNLYDITGSVRTQLNLDSSYYAADFGDNLLQLDLRNVGGMIDRHIYLFQLTNAKSELWYLKFLYRKPN
jgi:hypothetical protein